MEILATERLILRHLEARDLPELAALYADPVVRRYFPEGVLSTAETQEELDWFRHGHPEHSELGLWATIERKTGRFIGRCGLLPWDIDGRLEIEIAYLLGRDCWGRGLGAEAAQALVRHGFERLKLPRLIALIDPANTASIRVAEAAGLRFEREGDIAGGFCALYSILNPR
ncbi:GNAT family N-acetyltransferase [Dongia sp.]|uniref:GNAT family N-acetyltransferase n=1 Tax=Dongia sp. TaxID=1977262 RepID=UPI0035B3DC5F